MADLERGQRIKGLRRAKAERTGKRCTQQHMADAVGVSLRAAQEWDYGGGIDDEHLGPLIEFLETDADYLLRGQTPDLMGSLNGEASADPLERIERLLRRLLREQGIDPDQALEEEAEQVEPPADEEPREESAGTGGTAAAS